MSTELDPDYLFALARNKSAQGRAALGRVMSALFDDEADALSDRERHLMFGILRTLVHDVEVSVRKNISARLAELTDAPRELVEELANGDIDVAYPLLTKSKVLRDEALIDIVRLRTHEHQLAVTLRRDLSEDVSAALVQEGNEEVVLSLLENQTARISQATMAYLVEQSQRIDQFQDPLIRRQELTEDLARKMFMWVSAALREHIMSRFSIDAETVDQLLEDVARQGIQETVEEHEDAGHGLASALDDAGMITHNMVVAALMDGEVRLFLSLFSRITQLRPDLASKVVFEEGGEGLAIACKAVDFSEMHFAIILDKSRKARPARANSEPVKGSELGAKALYAKINRGAARKVLSRWQRGSEFLAALRELEQ